jgi:hypothetical protein
LRVLVAIIGLLLAGSGATTSALAWDSTGHQTVGAIADRLIAGTNAEAQVRSILGTSLRVSAVWADCAKGVERKGTKFTYTATGKHKECFPFETGSGKAEMANFVRRN